ncbi:hypothetical protein [Magnetococcus sp. PR-3]|uniref:hypothetical protein n=1 Tax=Magnetococcus sp. PR-3 TaxID=3120355 RepID=UPI002FCE13A8
MIDRKTVYDFWASHPHTVGALSNTNGHVTIFTHLDMEADSTDRTDVEHLIHEVTEWWRQHGEYMESCTITPYHGHPKAKTIAVSC